MEVRDIWPFGRELNSSEKKYLSERGFISVEGTPNGNTEYPCLILGENFISYAHNSFHQVGLSSKDLRNRSSEEIKRGIEKIISTSRYFEGDLFYTNEGYKIPIFNLNGTVFMKEIEKELVD